MSLESKRIQTNECEKQLLGEDYEAHERLLKITDKLFERSLEVSRNATTYEDSLGAEDIMRDIVFHLQEIISFRKQHGLPTNGQCNQCDNGRLNICGHAKLSKKT